MGASGKLGQYIIEQALAEGHQVHGVCRRESIRKLDRFGDRILTFSGEPMTH